MLHIRWHVKEEMKQVIVKIIIIPNGYLVFGAQNMTQILAVSSLPHTTRTAQKLTRPNNQIELPKKKNQDKNNLILNEKFMECHDMPQGVDSIPTNINYSQDLSGPEE